MKRIDRTGEVKMMHNGLMAEIIGYRNARNVNIQFQNGGIAHGIEYDKFKRGNVKCPMIIETIDDYAKIVNPNTNFEFICDIEDLALVNKGYWSMNSDGYAYNTKFGLFHRAIMNISVGMYIDHINHNRTDNRKNNLRICNNAENLHNTGKQNNNTSGFKGVCWDKRANKWLSRICLNGKSKHLGYYDDKLEAAKAYNEAAIKYHGEFACLNEI